MLAQPASRAGNGRWQVEVGNAVLRFVEARDGRGEGLAGIDLEVTDPQSITAAATACGCAWDGDAVMVGGVRFSLQTSR
ncbi:MAG TPA: hypothetical protein PKV56_12305 [Burkholderiaceae bacterium]|nr:hypothetical protein [Burkholderiaceae bacterium]